MFNQIATNDPILRSGAIATLFQSLLDPQGNMMLDQGLFDPYGIQLSEMLRSISDRQPMGDRSAGVLAQLERAISGGMGISGRPTTAAVSPTSVPTAPTRGVGRGFIEPLPGMTVPLVAQNMPQPQLPTRNPYDPAFLMFGRGDAANRGNAFQSLFGGRFPKPF